MAKISHLDVEQVKFKRTLVGLKEQAHKFFDKLWIHGYLNRGEAYQVLSQHLDVTEPEAHMSVMDEERCRETIRISIMLLNDMRRLDLDFGDEINHPYYELIE